MSDSKWKKLIRALTGRFDTVYVRFKLVSSDQIRETMLDMIEDKPFFIEPITYKEVEWIEFPAQYILTHNNRSTRRYEREYHQDIQAIEELIHVLGQFALQRQEGGLRLIAYT